MFTFKMRGTTFSAGSLKELSALYSTARDESGEGNSTFPKPTVRNAAGRIIGSFSYNGRIWAGKPTDASRTLVYDNRLEA
jgi:hypothetical protein